MHCPGGNATDLIWRVLAFSDGISSWTPLKPQQSNPNPNPLGHQLWCTDFLTLPHLSSSLTDSVPSLNLLCHSKTDARFMQDGQKAYRYSKVSDCIFEVHQLWQSGLSRVYSNSCCSSSFETEIIKISQSSHKMYTEFSRIYDNFKCMYKKRLETYWMHHVCIYIYMCVCVCVYICMYVCVYAHACVYICTCMYMIVLS